MDAGKEQVLCSIVCGMYYAYNRQEWVDASEKIFVENCLCNCNKSMSKELCNCLLLEQYMALRKSLNFLSFVADIDSPDDINALTNTLNSFIVECAMNNNQKKLQMVRAVHEGLDDPTVQRDYLDSTFFEVGTKDSQSENGLCRLGLMCWLHTSVTILCHHRNVKEAEKRFDCLKEMFIDNESVLYKNVDSICKAPLYYNIFANKDIILNGITDVDTRKIIDDVFSCIQEAINHLQSNELVAQRVCHDWFVVMHSLSNYT